MKVVILAGGMGTRLAEHTDVRPKPMIEIGQKPIIWHIMKQYSHFGLNEFVICLGYKGYVIKEYFQNYFLHQSDVTFDLKTNTTEVHQNSAEPWRITLVDTGLESQTGGRIRRIRDYIGNEDFCLTYGDGVSDVNIRNLIQFHKEHGRSATITATRPPGRFGALKITEGDQVDRFEEKPFGDGGWINGGFFVLKPSVFELLRDDKTVWEREPLESLAATKNLMAFKHPGFWHPMDTIRDKLVLEGLWTSGKAPWKVWSHS